MNLRKKETRLLHKMDAGWADMQLDKDGKSLFLLGSHKMQKMDTSSDALTPITFQVDAKMDLAAEREYMFDHVERYSRMYYDLSINMEGIDAIHHLLEKMEDMRREMSSLRKQLLLYRERKIEDMDWQRNIRPQKKAFCLIMNYYQKN